MANVNDWVTIAPGGDTAAPQLPVQVPAGTGGDWVTEPPKAPPPSRGVIGTVADFLRGAGNAVTLGSYDYWRPEVWMSDKPYGESVREQRGKTVQAAQDSPFFYNLGQATGGVPLGMGTGAATNKLVSTAALPLWKRMVVGGAEGATLGGVHGAVEGSYSGIPAEVAKNFGMGSIFGGGIGFGAPVVGALAGKVYRTIADRTGPIPRQMMDAAQADRRGLYDLPENPGSSIADAGPSLLGVAQGAVTGTGTAGPGRSQMVDTFKQRAREAGNRIVQGVRDIYGEAPIPSRVEAAIGTRMQEMGPAYE